MAAHVQVLLPLFCVLFAHGHVLHRTSSDFSSSLLNKPIVPDDVDVHTLFSPMNPDLSVVPIPGNRHINGHIFSYNDHHDYDDYYRDGNFDPHLRPYFGYPGSYEMHDYDDMPFGYPSVNGFDNGDHMKHKNKPEDKNHSGENSSDEKHEDHLQNSGQKDKSSEDISPKSHKKDKHHVSGDKSKVELAQNKDFILVDRNGNRAYLLHENIPNTNEVVLPNTNGIGGNYGVYVPYNPQQQANQVYQVVNSQPSVAANIPLTANRINLNNVVANPVVNNVPTSSGSSSYVLIYANGQLIKIPGVVVSSGNSGSNMAVPNAVPNPNVVYANQPNQGNNPVYVQVPNVSPVSNGVSNPGVAIQNPPLVANPNNIPNNNMPTYAVVNQPNPVSQPAVPNVIAGYFQPSGNSNIESQVPVSNPVNPNPSAPVSNPSIQPAYEYPINSNQPMYPPTQEKEANSGVPPPNNIPVSSAQPLSPQPVTQPSVSSNDANLGIQPAVMVSGFKETDNGKDKKKEDKDAKEIKKNKDQKKKESDK